MESITLGDESNKIFAYDNFFFQQSDISVVENVH